MTRRLAAGATLVLLGCPTGYKFTWGSVCLGNGPPTQGCAEVGALAGGVVGGSIYVNPLDQIHDLVFADGGRTGYSAPECPRGTSWDSMGCRIDDGGDP